MDDVDCAGSNETTAVSSVNDENSEFDKNSVSKEGKDNAIEVKDADNAIEVEDTENAIEVEDANNVVEVEDADNVVEVEDADNAIEVEDTENAIEVEDADNVVEVEDADNVVEVEDDEMEEFEESISKENENIESKPQAGEQIEVAVVTCNKDDANDADSSLEVFFDVDNENVENSTKLELQVEVNNITSELLEDDNVKPLEEKLDAEDNDENVQPIEEETQFEDTNTSKIEKTDIVQPMEEDKVDAEIPTEKIVEVNENVSSALASKDEEIDVPMNALASKDESNVTMNGDASPAEEITETSAVMINNVESTAEPVPAVNTSAWASDDVVLVSDDETDNIEEVAKDKADTTAANDESKNNLPNAVSTEEENVEKISAVAEILDESNTSDSSNLLEISVLQEEREKERLQEKTVEEDEEEDDEDVEVEDEDEDEVEKTNDNDIEVVESNLDADIGTPPAKRTKLNDEEKKEDAVLLESNEDVQCNDKNSMEEIDNNSQEAAANNFIEEALNSEEKEEKSEDVEMKEEENNAASVTTSESKENDVEMTYPPPKLSKVQETVPLEFLRRFKTNFETMTRTQLEEFVVQKIIEAIIHKSEFAELSRQLLKQEQISERHRNKITELSKQLKDLNKIHNTVVKDLQTHYTQTVLPLKITRAVGLQVSIPKRADISASAPKKDQPTPTINNEERAIQTVKPNAQLAAIAQKAATQAEKINLSNATVNRAVLPFAQAQQNQKQFFDVIKPSTSNAAKEGSLQIRKINTNT